MDTTRNKRKCSVSVGRKSQNDAKRALCANFAERTHCGAVVRSFFRSFIRSLARLLVRCTQTLQLQAANSKSNSNSNATTKANHSKQTARATEKSALMQMQSKALWRKLCCCSSFVVAASLAPSYTLEWHAPAGLTLPFLACCKASLVCVFCLCRQAGTTSVYYSFCVLTCHGRQNERFLAQIENFAPFFTHKIQFWRLVASNLSDLYNWRLN